MWIWGSVVRLGLVVWNDREVCNLYRGGSVIMQAIRVRTKRLVNCGLVQCAHQVLTAHGWGKLEGERAFVATNGAVGHGTAILPMGWSGSEHADLDLGKKGT
jgi:hypothetical protein